jgi:hypothetical protein
MKKTIEKKINIWQDNNPLSLPRFILLDFQSFQLLKEEVYGSFEVALEADLESFLGLKVFYNDTLSMNYIEIA